MEEVIGQINGRSSDSVLMGMVNDGLAKSVDVVEIPFGENLGRCGCFAAVLRIAGKYLVDVKSVSVLSNSEESYNYNYSLLVRRKK